MRRTVLRPQLPGMKTLAKRPDNRWCQHCNNWIHKDRFIRHCKVKHGIEYKPISVHAKQTITNTASKPKQSSINNRGKLGTNNADRFPEPLYERQPRFEGGIRWEQGGSSGLGKRR